MHPADTQELSAVRRVVRNGQRFNEGSSTQNLKIENSMRVFRIMEELPLY